MSYSQLLLDTPAHETPAFIDFLRERNSVIYDTKNWLGVLNYKYHRHGKLLSHIHYTYFLVPSQLNNSALSEMLEIAEEYADLSLYVNRPKARTVNRYHFHLINKGVSGLVALYIDKVKDMDGKDRLKYS